MKAEKQTPLDLTKQNLSLQESLATEAAYIAQLQRILWLTVKAAGGKVTLDEGSIPPLWRLDKRRPEGSMLLELTASVTEPLPPELLEKLATKLAGTSLHIEDVQEELGLQMWPADYLAFCLQNSLAWMNGKWVDATLARHIARDPSSN